MQIIKVELEAMVFHLPCNHGWLPNQMISLMLVFGVLCRSIPRWPRNIVQLVFSSLRLLNVLLILSWKSFHWRHSFSDILKWRFRKSKIWITMEETASPSSRFSPKCWKVKVFPSSSLIRFICHYPLSHKTGDKGALLFVPLLPGSPRPPSRPWKAPSNVQPCQKLQTQVER